MTDATNTFNAHAPQYDAARRRLIPPFEAFYGTAVEAVRLAGEPKRILDLGAGTGLLAAHVHAAHPAAELTLLDGATQMLERARATLGNEGISYVMSDLSDSLPTGPWDAVISALAIHHLDDPAKRALFSRIRAGLRPGGVFVNAEQVRGPGARFDALYRGWHEDRARAAGSGDAEWAGAVERMTHDRCSTVEDQLVWLRQAGFSGADCLFKDHPFAVLVAVR